MVFVTCAACAFCLGSLSDVILPSAVSTLVYRGGMFCAPWNRFPGSNLALISASRA